MDELFDDEMIEALLRVGLNTDLGLLEEEAPLKGFGGFTNVEPPSAILPESCERLVQFLEWMFLSKSCVVSDGAMVAGTDLVEPTSLRCRRSHCEPLNPAASATSTKSTSASTFFCVEEDVGFVARLRGCCCI